MVVVSLCNHCGKMREIKYKCSFCGRGFCKDCVAKDDLWSKKYGLFKCGICGKNVCISCAVHSGKHVYCPECIKYI